VALDVMAATASGVLLPTGKAEAVTCDVNDADDETVPEDGTLDPVDISEEFGDGVGSGLEAGGDPFSGGDFPAVPIDDGGGSLGGGGVGGGGGGSPGDGTEEEEDAKDDQDMTADGPPDIPVGGFVPQPYIDQLNTKIENTPNGTPVEYNLSKFGNREWEIVFSASALSAFCFNPDQIGGYGAGVSAVSVTATGFYSRFTLANAYFNNLDTMDYLLELDPWSEFGDPPVVYRAGGLIQSGAGFESPPGWQCIFSPTQPNLRVVSAKRLG
jgi:hypothetical protein